MNRLLQPPLLHFLSKSQAPIAFLFEGLERGYGRSGNKVKQILWDRVGVSSTRKSVYGFRTFCTAGDLAAKKCVPCNSMDLGPMTEESATQMLTKVAGWNLVNEDGILKLNRSWKVKSFTKGLELFQLIGNIAEAENIRVVLFNTDHHPDLHLVGWNDVKIEIWTHAVGGLTENDYILAAKINGLDLHHLLRKKSAKINISPSKE